MILQIFEPGSGGVLAYVSELTKHLITAGYGTAVAYSSCRRDGRLDTFTDHLMTARVPVVDLRVTNKPSHGDLIAISRIARFCRQLKPKLIHCHSSKAGALGRAVACLRRIPVVYTPHGYYGFNESRHRLWANLFDGVERIMGRIGHTVVTSSDERAFAAGRLGIDAARIVTISNGVDFSRFSPVSAAERVLLRQQQGLPEQGFVVAAICRLEYQKDPISLLAGFAEARRHCPGMHLYLVGDGALSSQVESAIRDKGVADSVTWRRFHAETPDVYRVADAFLSSARYEGMPLVVLEALASNLPLVITDCPGHRDFYELGLNRLRTMPVESPSLVGERLREMYHLAGDRTRTNHREIAENWFSKEICLNRTVSLYNQLLTKELK